MPINKWSGLLIREVDNNYETLVHTKACRCRYSIKLHNWGLRTVFFLSQCIDTSLINDQTIDNNYFTIRDILKAHYYIHISGLLIKEVENCYETLVYTQVCRCRFSIQLQDKLIRIILGAWMTIFLQIKRQKMIMKFTLRSLWPHFTYPFKI